MEQEAPSYIYKCSPFTNSCNGHGWQTYGITTNNQVFLYDCWLNDSISGYKANQLMVRYVKDYSIPWHKCEAGL